MGSEPCSAEPIRKPAAVISGVSSDVTGHPLSQRAKITRGGTSHRAMKATKVWATLSEGGLRACSAVFYRRAAFDDGLEPSELG